MAKNMKKERAMKAATDEPGASDGTGDTNKSTKNATAKKGMRGRGVESFDIVGLRKKLGEHFKLGGPVPTTYLAKQLAVVPMSLDNWAKGNLVSAENLTKLKKVEANLAGGTLSWEPPKPRGKPGRAKGAGKKAKAAKGAAKKTAAKIELVDVKALRSKIGVSRAEFAKLVGGASLGSIANWESGKQPQGKYLTKLNDLKQRVDAGEVAAEPATRNGRSPKQVSTLAKTAGRTTTAKVPSVNGDVKASEVAALLRAALTTKDWDLVSLAAKLLGK